MVCTAYEWLDAPDTKQNMKRAIRLLSPLAGFEVSPKEQFDDDLNSENLAELRRRALADSAASRTPVDRRALYRMRSRAVRLYVLRRANGKCEGCGASAPFETKDAQPYLEPHHIRRLTDGGPDDPRRVAGVCPNCHRRAHYSDDGDDFNKKLAAKVLEKEKQA
jgi:5-methylcytosine-specific restriction protein A